MGMNPTALPPGKPLLARVRSGCHHGRDLREDRADAGRDVRHNRAGSHGHKTRHQSVLDEVLTARVLQHS